MAKVVWWLSAVVCSVGVGLFSVPAGIVMIGVLGMVGALYLIEVKD